MGEVSNYLGMRSVYVDKRVYFPVQTKVINKWESFTLRWWLVFTCRLLVLDSKDKGFK